MKNESIDNILYEKYQNKKLASLYLVNYNSQKINIENWVENFVKKITPLEDHPDVLKIKKDDKANEYKVDSQSIKDFLKFLNYRPLLLEKKFIFLYDAHDLSVIVSNKLLKIFEELGQDFCLVLLVPDNAVMLATVLSRAVKLQINSQVEVKDPKVDQIIELKNPQDLINFLKKNPEISTQYEKKAIEHRIDQVLSQSTPQYESYLQLTQLLKNLKDFETANDFNNSKLSRLSYFFP
jgi:DNA polymerase III delta prime subunit